MAYQLICDSCTDLPEEELMDPRLVWVPLGIRLGGRTLTDSGDIPQAALLEAMGASPDAPATSCPSPQAFLQHFREDVDNYVVTLSGRLSGSYNAAMQARAIYREEGGQGNVHVFNTRSASAGQTQVALLVRELAGKRLPFTEVVPRVEAYIDRMQTLFVLDNLDNLRKNGRLTKLQSLVTGTLRIKLLCGGTREGEIEKLGQGLTLRQTLARMVSRMAADPDHRGRRLVLAHCACAERAASVRDLCRERCDFGEILIVPCGGISTVYANAGGLVAAY